MAAVLAIFLLVLIFLPNFLVHHTLRKYSRDLASVPGSGSELARHLIDRFKLEGVSVEETNPNNDHYDQAAKCVRLSPNVFHGRSLTAVAVATHEVGHAIQFTRQEDISRLRNEYLPKALAFRRLGIGIMSIVPIVGAIVHVPAVMIATLVLGVIAMMIGAAMYLIILPEEWDASFNKALPILLQGEYIQPDQEKAIKQILGAAAFTYFAAAMADILSIWRWIAILRR